LLEPLKKILPSRIRFLNQWIYRTIKSALTPYPTGRLFGVALSQALRALEFGHFEDRFQGAARSVARAIGEEESKKVNEAQRTAKQLGGMTHHVNGGRPGRQACSRADGSIGVPPVFPIRVQDDDQKLAGRTSPRSHSPICSRHSATQARRLCYHRLGVMPPLRPVGESSLLEMSKLQRHFAPGYDRTVPPGHFATGSS